MAEKTDDENRLPGRMLRLPQALWDELDAVAKTSEVNAQKLLHRAARALVRCHHEFGSVPLDMRLVQAEHPSRAPVFDASVNEPVSLTPAQAKAAEQLRQKAASAETPKASRAARK